MSEKNIQSRGYDLLPDSLKELTTTEPQPPIITYDGLTQIIQAILQEVYQYIEPIKSKADDAHQIASNALPRSGGLVTGNLNIGGALNVVGDIGGNIPEANIEPEQTSTTEMTTQEIQNEIVSLKAKIAYLESLLVSK